MVSIDNVVTPSIRADLVTRRTYNRKKADKTFETWFESVDRCVVHQRWLWERALGRPLNAVELAELDELRWLMYNKYVLLAGRTLWLGGTDLVKKRESCQFNCAFLKIETVYDIVDGYHLLLQGCGVGALTVVGSLYGFPTKIPELEIIRSTRTSKGGRDDNHEYYDKETKIWYIQVGDSSEAWAKAAGKLVAGKYTGCKKLVLDFSQIRPEGTELAGYGWLSCGDKLIAKAFAEIFNIMNSAIDCMLAHQQIKDIHNLLGTTLSNRRSAEILFFYFGDSGWEQFATCKQDLTTYWWRDQSNNTLIHRKKPSREELEKQFALMIQSPAGSEPGILNEQEAKRRAPWFSGLNPCAEIILANRGFCNLTTVNLTAEYHKDFSKLLRSLYIIARANYRQTCVNLEDGILHRGWHENNQMLRLCGVSLCGIVQRLDLKPEHYREMRRAAKVGAYDQAEELGMQVPKNVTTLKPEGTAPKIMGTRKGEVTSGMSQAIGRYEFNTINFGVHEPLVKLAMEAGYRVRPHPKNSGNVLITIPVFNGDDVPLVANETAIEQLDRYKMLMDNWCDQNVSCTILYSKDEVPGIIDWLLKNWDSYVAASFMFKADVLDLELNEEEYCAKMGYDYLPQRAVSQKEFEAYVKNLKEIDLNQLDHSEELDKEVTGCGTGGCPIK